MSIILPIGTNFFHPSKPITNAMYDQINYQDQNSFFFFSIYANMHQVCRFNYCHIQAYKYVDNMPPLKHIYMFQFVFHLYTKSYSSVNIAMLMLRQVNLSPSAIVIFLFSSIVTIFSPPPQKNGAGDILKQQHLRFFQKMLRKTMQ